MCIIENVIPSVRRTETLQKCRFIAEKKGKKPFNPVLFEGYFGVTGLEIIYG